MAIPARRPLARQTASFLASFRCDAVPLFALCTGLLLAGLVPGGALASEPRTGREVAARGEARESGWWSRARESIQASEYRVTWQSATDLPDLTAAWQAPNRTHGFRTYFTDEGIRVVPRTEEGPAWEWGLSLVGYGRGRGLWPVLRTTPTPEANRVDYQRGGVVEWYLNDTHGLEQGFTLPRPPGRSADEPAGSVARADDGAVLLALEMRGDLRPVLSADGRAIDLMHASSVLSVAHYGGLLVRDATDRELPAWMEIVSGSGVSRIYLLFDDTDAVYPVTVDPLLQSEAWSKEGNQESAHFGWSVAGAGNVNGDGLCAGGANDGEWCQLNEDCPGGDCFEMRCYGGQDGLCRDAETPCTTGAECTEQGDFCDNDKGKDCSSDADCDGGRCRRTVIHPLDDVVVGAPGFDAGQTNEGRAFVYLGSPSGLETAPAWTAESDAANTDFGLSVGAGDVNGDGFSDVVIGAPYYDGGMTNQGRVCIYHGSPAGLEADPAFEKDSAGNGIRFGISLSMAGDINNDGCDDLVVGADQFNANQGRAYAFLGSSSGMTPNYCFAVSHAEGGGKFGASVAIAGDLNDDGYDDVVVGMPKRGPTYSGAAFFYEGTGSSSCLSFLNAYEHPYEGAHCGWSVAGVGDVNRDGYDDVGFTAPLFDSYKFESGSAYVWSGQYASQMPGSTGNALHGRIATGWFGLSISAAGDVNGDGYDDVIVASRSHVSVHLGRADENGYFHAAADDWSSTLDISTWNTGWTNSSKNQFVARAGDVNGDGYDDVIIGDSNFSGDKASEGRAAVYHGAEDPGALRLAQNLFEADVEITDAGGVQNPGYCDESDVYCTSDMDCADEVCELVEYEFDWETAFWTNKGPDQASVYYGSVPNSVVISTGLGQDEGRGSTDIGLDGKFDMVLWGFKVEVPKVCHGGLNAGQICTADSACDASLCDTAKSLRFDTQMITHEINRSTPFSDILKIRAKRDGWSAPVWDWVKMPTTAAEQPAVARGVSVEGLAQGDEIEVGFQIEDASDGLYDTAVIVSDMFFTDIPLVEGRELSVTPDSKPDWVSNPAPQDTSAIAGTYSYGTSLFKVPGFGMPFDLSIRYNSASTEQSSLGPKWTHSFDAKVQKIKDQRTVGGNLYDVDVVIVQTGSGGSEYFRCVDSLVGNHYRCWQGAGVYKPKHAGVYSALTQGGIITGITFDYTTKTNTKYDFDVKQHGYSDPPTADDQYDTYFLKRVTDSNGNAVDLFYDADKRLDYVIDTRGTVFTFNYDAQGRLTSVESSEAGGHVVTFEYDVFSGLLASFTDLLGQQTSFTYDTKGNLLTCTDHEGVKLAAVEYEEYVAGAGVQQIGHRVFERRNANSDDPGLSLTFTGDTVETRNREGGIQISRYDVKSHVHEQMVYLGGRMGLDGPTCSPNDPTNCWAVTKTKHEAVCIYGAKEGQSCSTDADCPSSYCGSTGNPIEQIDPLDGITESAYDTRGNPVFRKNALGYPQVMHYDDRDNIVMQGIPHEGHPCSDSDCCCVADPGDTVNCDVTDPWDTVNCDVTTFEYWPDTDNLKRQTDPKGNAVTYTYTDEGQVETVTDALANGASPPDPPPGAYYWETQYNALGYPETEIDPLLNQTTHTYNNLGQRTSTTDANGHTTSWALDSLGRVLEQIDALGQSTSHTYDVHGRTLSTQEDSGATYTNTYTPTGQRETETDPLGHTANFAYDHEDRLTSRTDPLGLETAYQYDAAGRMTGVVDATGGTAAASYDKLGRMTALEDPRGNVTQYEYDELGQLLAETDPLDNTLGFTYDHRGLLSTRTNARDQTEPPGPPTLSHLYDAAGRLVTVGFGGGVITHALDLNGNALFSDSTHLDIRGASRTFDVLNRLESRTDDWGYTVSYAYDPVGNVEGIDYPDGSRVVYGYDELNRLVRVEDWYDPANPPQDPLSIGDCENSADCRLTVYRYDNFGNLEQTTLPDGSTVDLTYDAAHRLETIVDQNTASGAIFDVGYTLDAAGRRIGMSETAVPLQPPPPADTERRFAHDEANQLVSDDIDDDLEDVDYIYDEDGNMEEGSIDGADLTFAYNELNQLVSAGSDTYEYDVDGFRVEVNGSRRFVYDTTGSTPRLLEERNAAGQLVARYVHGLGLISRDDGTGLRVYHYDSRGSTIALTDESGGITDRYAYDPFGALVGHTDGELTECDHTTCTENVFRYNGRDGVQDDGNGLYLMRTRYYAPELMRFIQRDQVFDGSLEDPQTLNRYAYVGGNPIQRVDPNGDFWGWQILANAVFEGAVEFGFQLASGDVDWGAIGAAAVGGAVEGLVDTLCPLGCGPLGATLGELTKQGLAGDGFDPLSLGVSFVGGSMGKSLEKSNVTGKADDAARKAYAETSQKGLLDLANRGLRISPASELTALSRRSAYAGIDAAEAVLNKPGSHLGWRGTAVSEVFEAGYDWLRSE